MLRPHKTVAVFAIPRSLLRGGFVLIPIKLSCGERSEPYRPRVERGLMASALGGLPQASHAASRRPTRRAGCSRDTDRALMLFHTATFRCEFSLLSSPGAGRHFTAGSFAPAAGGRSQRGILADKRFLQDYSFQCCCNVKITKRPALKGRRAGRRLSRKAEKTGQHKRR